MNGGLRRWLLRGISSACKCLNKHLIFRVSAQTAHDNILQLLRLSERLPLTSNLCALLHRLIFTVVQVQAGGASLSQRLILAAGLVKGDGFASETEALQAVTDKRRNIIPGWRILPALLGPVEFGSFTRHPRLGNTGTVVWRETTTHSTQNHVGLRNPGARAAARFLGDRRRQLPAEFGINIAVSPDIENVDEQERHIVESLSFFLDAPVHPTWFTLNLSCPNTEDDPQGHQLEAETKQLCRAFIAEINSRALDIPLWVKISPGLATEQYRALMRVFHEVGVKAVIATNTLGRPSPDDAAVQAGVGGGDLFPDALDAVRQLLAEKSRKQYAVDVIACGGILDGASFRQYLDLGVQAGQYWSALVYRGPFAAAIIAYEIAESGCDYETIRSERFA